MENKELLMQYDQEVNRLRSIIKELQEENNNLKDGRHIWYEHFKQSQHIINKAIDYMEHYIKVEDTPINERIKIEFEEVLKILKGGENE